MVKKMRAEVTGDENIAARVLSAASVLNPTQDAGEPQRSAREPVLRARREARSPASSKPGQRSASPPRPGYAREPGGG